MESMSYRVGRGLARGIVGAAALLVGVGVLSSPPPPPEAQPDVERAVELVRHQDFAPLFRAAGDRVDAYFDPARQEAFLDELFSLSGKWKAVTRGRESYERHVRKLFEKHVFSPADFAKTVIEAVKADYAAAAGAAENRVLVGVFDDLRLARPRLEFGRLETAHGRLAADLAPAVFQDLGLNLISLAGAEAAATLGVAALTSAGVLAAPAAGGASSLWTFGAGLVAGLVAGLAIDATAGAAWEDAARARVRAETNRIRMTMIDEVHSALAQAVLAWRRLEEEAVRELYRGERHGPLARR
jgi:hypothetical protein